jgi:hypothetical protein
MLIFECERKAAFEGCEIGRPETTISHRQSTTNHQSKIIESAMFDCPDDCT